jgi:hypothetical protein
MRNALLFLIAAVALQAQSVTGVPSSNGGGSSSSGGAVTSVFGQTGAVGAVGDLSATGGVVKVNGAAVPASAPLLGSNSSGQPVTANSPTITGPLTIAPAGGGAGAIDYLCGTTPSPLPSSGYVTPFCNSANSNHFSVVNSAGTVTDMQPTPGGYVLLSEQVLASPASSVTFSSIPSTYRNLRLVISGRCSASQTDDGVYLQFNSDTGANYSRQYLVASVASLSAGQSVSSSSGLAIGDVSCGTALANAAGSSIMDIPNYSGTTFLKTAVGTSGGVSATGGAGGIRVFTFSGFWNSTAAINSILVQLSGGSNFVAGSVFDLYAQ